MEDLLPTIVVVLTEIIAILVIALGVALYLHTHKNKRHRAELNAVMDIARHAEMLPPAPDHATQYASADTEFTARTNQSIGDIREAIARLDVKFGLIHQEDQLHDKDLDHRIEEENAQIRAVRGELHDLTAALHEIKGQYATLEQSMHNLREELEHHARHNAQSDEKPAKNGKASSIDDFTLPDSVLAELDEVEKSLTAQPASAANAASATAKKSVMPRAVTRAQKIPRRSHAASSTKAAPMVLKNGTVDEPQYAFDPARVDDSFNMPYFIPGAANTGINVEELDFEDLSLENQSALMDTPADQTQFDSERVFYQASPHTGIKAGWYFSLRGGKTHGPFGSKEAGERVLNEMIEHFKRTGDAGGR